MNNIKILDELFDKKILKIIRLFLENKDYKFYLREIAKKTNVPIASSYRIVQNLLKLKIIDLIKVNKFKVYKTANNETITFLESFIKEGKRIIQSFVEEIKALPNIQSIILHGEEKDDKANILIIGENLNTAKIKEISSNIKETYKFTITYLTLTKEQYDQMSSMGLYSGRKRVLYP